MFTRIMLNFRGNTYKVKRQCEYTETNKRHLCENSYNFESWKHEDVNINLIGH